MKTEPSCTSSAWFAPVREAACEAARDASLPRRAWLLRSGAALAAAGGAWRGVWAQDASVNSPAIDLQLPEIAEDGRTVPVSVSCSLPGVREIAIVIEPNPIPLAAQFDVPAGAEAYVATRVKIARSGRVLAHVRTDSGTYSAYRDVKVITGGCGD
jgi:predicted secreted protein